MGAALALRFNGSFGLRAALASGAAAAILASVAAPAAAYEPRWFDRGMYAPQPAIMAEMFPTRMRYSGVSLGYQVTSIVAGSAAPLIAVKLLEIYDSWVPIAIYLAIAAAITLVAVFYLRETNGLDLETLDDSDRDDLAKAGVV